MRRVVRLCGRSGAHAPFIASEGRERCDGGRARARHRAGAADRPAHGARSAAVRQADAEGTVKVAAGAALGAAATRWSDLIALGLESSFHCRCWVELRGESDAMEKSKSEVTYLLAILTVRYSSRRE